MPRKSVNKFENKSNEENLISDSSSVENIQLEIIEQQENQTNQSNNSKKEKKLTKKQKLLLENQLTNEVEQSGLHPESDKESGKKRGRKPKGGKLIIKDKQPENAVIPLPNIILHLKCSSQDVFEYNNKLDCQITDPLSYKPLPPPEIMTYNDYSQDSTSSNIFSKYESSATVSNNTNTNTNSNTNANINQLQFAYYKDGGVCKICNHTPLPNPSDEDISLDEDTSVSMKDISLKLKNLRIQFFKNTLQDKKSACFWCTYEFDSPPCYIPKQEMDTTIIGYGSFCRPECAVGYLMKEALDDSTKFERYNLLNRIYSKAYGFKKNIKPAPSPYYLLDKFYGSLTIQEYRKLLNSNHMMLVLEKPMTRILPELHEDNEEFILNIYGAATEQSNQKSGGMYKVKRQSEKQQGPTKTSIMKNNFGITN
jgi:hypothetical protein